MIFSTPSLLPGFGSGEKNDELEADEEDCCGGGECIRLAGKAATALPSYVGEKMLLYGLAAARGFLAGGDCSSGARVVVEADWFWDWDWV